MNKQEKFENKFYKLLKENNIELLKSESEYKLGDINTSVGMLSISAIESEPRRSSWIFTRFDNPKLAKEKTDCNPFSGKWNFCNSDMDRCLDIFFGDLIDIL